MKGQDNTAMTGPHIKMEEEWSFKEIKDKFMF